MSERADFAQAVIDAGIRFIGKYLSYLIIYLIIFTLILMPIEGNKRIYYFNNVAKKRKKRFFSKKKYYKRFNRRFL